MSNPKSEPFLPTSEDFPEAYEDFRRKSKEVYTRIAMAVNRRGIGIYPTDEETSAGNRFTRAQANVNNSESFETAYRKVFRGTAFTGANIPHGIEPTPTAGSVFTNIYGVVRSGLLWYPMSWTDGTDYIGITVDANDIIFATSLVTPLDDYVVVLEYLKATS